MYNGEKWQCVEVQIPPAKIKAAESHNRVVEAVWEYRITNCYLCAAAIADSPARRSAVGGEALAWAPTATLSAVFRQWPATRLRRARATSRRPAPAHGWPPRHRALGAPRPSARQSRWRRPRPRPGPPGAPTTGSHRAPPPTGRPHRLEPAGHGEQVPHTQARLHHRIVGLEHPGQQLGHRLVHRGDGAARDARCPAAKDVQKTRRSERPAPSHLRMRAR